MQVLSQRSDTGLQVTHIAVRDLARPRAPFVDTAKLVDNWRVVCEADDVDVVIEVMGGIDVAHDVVRHALENGKSVVTANKALMATHGEALRRLAQRQGVDLRHEASVLGGIPALHTIETYFRLNRIVSLRGIVNGTSNYILTEMHDKGMAFDAALHQAKELGYAEPNPSSDIEGQDAFFKLQVLLQALGVDTSALVHGGDVSVGSRLEENEVTSAMATVDKRPRLSSSGRIFRARLVSPVEGITAIDAAHIEQAKQQARKVKHIASAVWNDDTGEVLCKVGPETLDPTDPLYSIDGVNNALCLNGDIVGSITLVGPGAGALPTASAVLEDVLKIGEYV